MGEFFTPLFGPDGGRELGDPRSNSWALMQKQCSVPRNKCETLVMLQPSSVFGNALLRVMDNASIPLTGILRDCTRSRKANEASDMKMFLLSNPPFKLN